MERGGVQVVGGWREPDSLVSCCIFEAANNHPLVVSYFSHFGPLQMVVKY